ncbi:unnamed protein product [Cladocopium goreaui]|uniref:Uncharacterized protein n=1 Tax=Cladocopium goreaui TaxID=2562237 RepID=A0A9P1GF29_9DINO|nr:unnamed protein product [Cladocopium goreaui]
MLQVAKAAREAGVRRKQLARSIASTASSSGSSGSGKRSSRTMEPTASTQVTPDPKQVCSVPPTDAQPRDSQDLLFPPVDDTAVDDGSNAEPVIPVESLPNAEGQQATPTEPTEPTAKPGVPIVFGPPCSTFSHAQAAAPSPTNPTPANPPNSNPPNPPAPANPPNGNPPNPAPANPPNGNPPNGNPPNPTPANPPNPPTAGNPPNPPNALAAGNPPNQPSGSNPPPAEPADDPEVSKKAAKNQYMRYYRSLRSLNCPPAVRQKFDEANECPPAECQQKLQELFEEFKRCNGDWLQSSICLQESRSHSTATCGIWKWLTRSDT